MGFASKHLTTDSGSGGGIAAGFAQDGFQDFIAKDYLTAVNGAPGTGQFRSTISNRTPALNLANDLLPRLGVDRVETQQIGEVQTEFGPSNERVYKPINDYFDLVRFVGNWTNYIGGTGSGVYVRSNNQNDFMEIVFYGTGLNLLTRLDNASNDLRVTVDGNAEGSNIFNSSNADFMNGRSYSTNGVLQVATGLTLGVHTIKIRQNASSGTNFYVYGYEVLTEATTLKVPTGTAYASGTKLSHAALESPAYSSSFDSGSLSTRGGRVLCYVKADGSFGKSVTPTNSSQANMSSADHTNEDIVRTYNWREFGSGRSDDFSTLTISGSANAGFTLDDGTTTLFVQNGSASAELYPSTNTDYITFTFVGTGLDIIEGFTTSPVTTYTVLVDGTAIVTSTQIFAGVYGNRLKIVSGLPYGTHIVKFLRTTSSGPSGTFRSFVVYQPKKPSLPTGAVELCEYNVMADFAANSSSDINKISTGVLRKSCTREINYIEGTGGTTNWNIPGLNPAYCDGRIADSDRLNAAIKYPFFGTGFDFRFETGSANSSNITVSLNGTTLTATNFPTASFSVYGTGATFNSSTGQLDQLDGTGSEGGGLVVSGLPLAEYVVKFNNNTASSFIEINSLDIITPIHAARSTMPADMQNTLAVGSCAISDNRKLSPVKDSNLQVKSWGQATGITSGPTTSSTSFISLPDMSLNLSTGAGSLEISLIMSFFNSGNNNVEVQFYVDNIAVGTPIRVTAPSSSQVAELVNRVKIPVSKGFHKIDAYWKVDAGTATAYLTDRILTAQEA